MSAANPLTRGLPRWSVARLAGLAPRSNAGLPASGRLVWVGPPLAANGPSSGLSGAAAVPSRLKAEATDRDTVSATPIRLWSAVIVRLPQAGAVRSVRPFAALLPATMLLWRLTAAPAAAEGRAVAADDRVEQGERARPGEDAGTLDGPRRSAGADRQPGQGYGAGGDGVHREDPERRRGGGIAPNSEPSHPGAGEGHVV